MKFGCDFYKAQRPQWANAYLDYDGLKQILKRKDLGHQRYDFLKDSLSEQTIQLNRFVDKQSSLVSLWFQVLKSRFSIQHSTPLALHDWTKIALPELNDLESSLLEVLSFVKQVETFSGLNRDAIARILRKAEAGEGNWTWPSQDNGSLYVRPWSVEAARMTALLQDLQRTIDLRLEEGNDASSCSLILEKVHPVALGCSQEDVVDEVRADNSSALMVVLASPVSYLENQAMLYSVTQVAIVHQSIDCIESLLDEITSNT
ncbi:glycerophosphoryl diester phosphodiesterase [Apiospora arundinis]